MFSENTLHAGSARPLHRAPQDQRTASFALNEEIVDVVGAVVDRGSMNPLYIFDRSVPFQPGSTFTSSASTCKDRGAAPQGRGVGPGCSHRI